MSKQTIIDFYEAFKRLDAKAMGACYHSAATFKDPAFGQLNADEARAMWKMLIQRSNGDLKVDYSNVVFDNETGSADWEADYFFGKSRRPVHNVIHASMKFEGDLIVEHVDEFSFWKWSSMALGLPGRLLGWTPYLQNKVRNTAHKSLRQYLEQSSS